MRNLALLLLVACGTESSPKPATGSATGSGSSVTVPIDAAQPVIHRTRIAKVRAELPDLGSIQRAVMQPDGKLLVIGDEAIARVDTDLALDQSFGTGGVVKLDLKEAELQTAAVDRKGRVIVVGHVDTKKRVEDLLVVRLRANGSVDLHFGNEGKLTQDFGSTDDRPSGVFVMPSGDIVVIGSHQQGKGGQNYEGYLARFDANGKRAPKVAFFDCIPKSREFVTRSMVDGDGFVIGGYAYSPDAAKSGVFVARVNGDGTLDRDFGDAGVTRTSSAELGGQAVSWELTTAKNGDILLGGASGDVIEKYRGFILRMTKNGALVSTWGKRGVGWGARDAKWMSMVADEGDGITAVNRFDGSLTRLDANGELDLAFGVDGVVRGEKDDEYETGVLEASGDIVVAGRKLLARFGPTTSTTTP